MDDGNRARPRWWSRPQGQPPADGAPARGTHDSGGDRISGAPPAPPERPNATPSVAGTVPQDGAPAGGRPPGARPPGAWPGGRRRPSRLATGGLAIALVAGVFGGLTGALLGHGGAGVSLPQAPSGSTSRGPSSIAGIAQASLPGVVYIHVKAGDEEATGTGIILDSAGHILTNNHVVHPTDGPGGTIDVTFNGGQTRRAALVGRDGGYDLAVVKVNGMSGLKPLTLGNSSSVRVGDPVIAIGAPYDLEGTVTSGIISARDRPITAAGDAGDSSDVSYVDALQTDAPINPGNSGGPLMNELGQVIGINSAIRSADSGSGGQGGSIGLGFAIPVNQARQVAQQLINTGHAVHPVIGITVDLGYTGNGARVATKGSRGGPAVIAGGPGALAGLAGGDVITAIDGVPVHSGPDLIVRARAKRPGDRIRLTVRRGGRTFTARLVLGGSTNGE